MIKNPLHRYEVKIGDIWIENDPRVTRYVKVIDLTDADVTISTCTRGGDIKHNRANRADIRRFNEKVGGYSLFMRIS